jgi:hypothetical protein
MFSACDAEIMLWDASEPRPSGSDMATIWNHLQRFRIEESRKWLYQSFISVDLFPEGGCQNGESRTRCH